MMYYPTPSQALIAASTPLGVIPARRESGSLKESLLPRVLQVISRALLLLLLAEGSLNAAWTWQSHEGHRSATVHPPQGLPVGFTLLDPATTGVRFTNTVSEARAIRNRNLLSGSGVAAGDVDGDGSVDLYFCGLDGDNVLYRNLGDWRFEEITQSAGVACPGLDATGAAFADIDGDGDLDLLINFLGGGTRLFVNDGKGHFRETTQEAGLTSNRGSTSLALADIDGDGDLDLYVTNFRPSTTMDKPGTQFRIDQASGKPRVVSVDGKPASLPEYTNRFELGPMGNVMEYGEPDDLFINDGQGHFKRRPVNDGSFLDENGKPLSQEDRDWGLAVQFHDLNGDGAPDLYVCNDLFTPDRIWMNDGRGSFRALSALSLRNCSTFSMGVDCADINRDGFVDLFTVDMLSRDRAQRLVQVNGMSNSRLPPGVFDNRQQFARNTLHLARGDGTYAEVAEWAGVSASEWSWGPAFLDMDLDGYEDLLIINGQLRDFQNGDISMALEQAKTGREFSFDRMLEVLNRFPSLHTPNVAYRNKGDGSFEDRSEAWGFATPVISEAMAMADLDNDGDLDVVVTNLGSPAGLYRNNASASRIQVRLKGRGGNTQGIGGRIFVRGGPVEQSQEILCGGRYLSGDQSIRTFAAGDGTKTLSVEVRWRSGAVTRLAGLSGNQILEIPEPQTSLPAAKAAAPTQAPWFSDATSLLRHIHQDQDFDDFVRQPLTPRRLSLLGPGVAWLDLNSDGWEDLAIGSGLGGHTAVFLNQKGASFDRQTEAPFAKPTQRDQTTVTGLGSTLFIGSSNYEDGRTNGGCVRIYDLQRKTSGEIILGKEFSVGPLAMTDLDGDGDLDLFVGGRSLPGRYPEAATSLLLRNDQGRFVEWQRWDKLGLASGALFADLDGDGSPELVIACDWGPIRVFRNLTGKPEEVTAAWGIASFLGWWNSVAAGDFDGDGRIDLVGGNGGLNTRHHVSPEHLWKVFYDDWSGTGSIDLVEASRDTHTARDVFERGLHVLGGALPFLRERVGSFADFSKMSVQEAFGDRLSTARSLEVNHLATTLFLNRGGRFEARLLPSEAQWSTVFGITVGDLDGDGNEDLFLAQNCSANDTETWRQDAGRGLILRGDGTGSFQSVPGQHSGIAVYGDQRGCAASDFNHDGRLDLVVSQNANATRLFRNETARPGLRVSLVGPSGNPCGAGARLQLIGEAGSGYAREIRLGSGYWSTEGPTQILTAKGTPKELRVRWPGKELQTLTVAPGTREMRLSSEGKLLTP